MEISKALHARKRGHGGRHPYEGEKGLATATPPSCSSLVQPSQRGCPGGAGHGCLCPGSVSEQLHPHHGFGVGWARTQGTAWAGCNVPPTAAPREFPLWSGWGFAVPPQTQHRHHHLKTGPFPFWIDTALHAREVQIPSSCHCTEFIPAGPSTHRLGWGEGEGDERERKRRDFIWKDHTMMA